MLQTKVSPNQETKTRGFYTKLSAHIFVSSIPVPVLFCRVNILSLFSCQVCFPLELMDPLGLGAAKNQDKVQ